jgi:hypothetical protein
MAITQAVANSFKQQLLEAKQNFLTSGSGGNTFKLALYSWKHFQVSSLF